MVNLPCVCWFCSANACSFLIGSDWETAMQNLTFPFVYSWPGCVCKLTSPLDKYKGNRDAYIDLGIIRQRSKRLVQCLVHLLGISFKETTTSCHSTLAHVHEQKEKERNIPPMNNVSPVNTTRCSPSCMKKQILSCVWQGVCRASTEMRSPILNFSPCFGVEVTDKQFRPPMMGSLPNCSSWVVRYLVWPAGPGVYLLSRCFRRHGPSDWIVSSFAIHGHSHIEWNILMGVDNSRKINLPILDLGFQDRYNPTCSISTSTN